MYGFVARVTDQGLLIGKVRHEVVQMPQKIALFLLLLLVGFGPMTALGGEPLESLRSSLPNKVGDWKQEGEDQWFDSRTIFDYINGAGEVYRAYNMRRCLARRYSKQGASLTLDIFDMSTPEGAFGVFTYDRQGDPVKLGQEGLSGAGWTRFWKGRFFVSILDEAQTPDSARIVETLARSIAELIREHGHKPLLVLQLPSKGLQADTIRYFHDPTILNTHYYVSDENILGLGPETDAVLASYGPERGGILLLLVLYPTEKDALAAHRSVLDHYLPDAGKRGAARLENGYWSAAEARGRSLAFVLEAKTEEDAKGLISEVLGALERSDKKGAE